MASQRAQWRQMGEAGAVTCVSGSPRRPRAVQSGASRCSGVSKSGTQNRGVCGCRRRGRRENEGGGQTFGRSPPGVRVRPSGRWGGLSGDWFPFYKPGAIPFEAVGSEVFKPAAKEVFNGLAAAAHLHSNLSERQAVIRHKGNDAGLVRLQVL